MQQVTGFFLASFERYELDNSDVSAYPGVAALASQIEMFHMSKRELEEKFTVSELFFVAWRSSEIAFGMEKKFKATGLGDTKVKNFGGINVPQNLPEHFFNEQGELDLRRVTGREAYRYFQAIGIPLAVMPAKE